MPRKTKDPLAVETKEYRVFNPENIKKTVEIPIVEPVVEKIEYIEKVGKIKPKKSVKKISSENKLKKDGYKLIITEKPQAAQKISAALSNGNDNRLIRNKISYYELNKNGERIVVCCAVGHLFSVSQNIKGSYYPIFDIGWHPNFEINKKDFTKNYYDTIKWLVKGASEIIVATDFDVEGEVIGYNIVRYIAMQKDARRMKFSSLTAEEIKESYDKRLPNIEWGQAIAGETRHFLDWMYGINLSRALMNSIKKAGKFRIMSIGRVQGPALNFIVDKELKIKAFKPSPYWQIFLEVSDGKNVLEVKHNKDIIKKEEIEKFKKLEGNNTVAHTIKTKQIISPPAPFDLTTLQTEAYKFHGITPNNTLASAQKLYLDGLISYPRTSSQKIPDVKGALIILEKLKKIYKNLTDNAVNNKPIEGKKSDPAHPAIIPTGNYGKLDGQELKIYELIVKRFIGCFCDNAELENKKIEIIINNLNFYARGMEILKYGWMKVYPVKMEEKEIQDMNGKVCINKVKIEEKETQPPNRYSPASIITELEKRNLGTKATRANILETLYNRKYIEGKSITATELGIKLIESLKKNSPVIIDEKLTREIEKDMEVVRSSKKDLEKKEKIILDKAEKTLIKISEDFKNKELEIGNDLIEANDALIEKEKENNKLGFNCPECKKGELIIKFTPRFRSYFVACSSYPECRKVFSLPKGLIKNENKKCESCGWPLVLRIMQGKRPWQLCFNPNCSTKKSDDSNNKNRYLGEQSDIKRKKIEDIEKVERV